MTFFFEVFDDFFKFLSQFFHILKIVSSQALELFYGVKDFNQFHYSSTEKVESSEDLSFTKIEGFAFGHVGDLVLGSLIAVLIFFVKSNTTSQDFDQLHGVSVPDEIRFLSVEDSLLTVGDHLIGNFHEKASHFISSVVKSGDGVDHFDGIHEGGKSINDLRRGSVIEGVNEFFQGSQIFHVIFSFI